MATPTNAMNQLPEFQGDVYDIQTKQALAQALLGNALKGNLEAYRPAGGGYAYVPKMGIGGLLGQLGQGLAGALMQRQVTQGLNDLGARQQAAYQALFTPQTQTTQATPEIAPGDVTPGSFGIGTEGGFTGASPNVARATLASALAPKTTTSTPAALNPQGMDPNRAATLAQLMGLPEYAKSFVAPYYAPTEATKLGLQAGLTPEQIQQANAATIRKNTYLAPTTYKPGDIVTDPNDPTKTLRTFANLPQGMQETTLADGTKIAVPIQGYNEALQGQEAAKARGAGVLESEKAFVQNPETGQWQEVMQPKGTANASFGAAGATTPFQRAQVQTESNGNPNAVSPKGAMGAWQVMPNTNANPGFGVTPARDNSRAELDRVGRDYSTAMVNRYGNEQLGAIAYNMGPGTTDAWLKKGGKWEDLPAETRNYMGKVSLLTAMNSQPQQQQAPRGSTFASAPLGAQAEANSAATGARTTMDESYKGLRVSRDSAQNAITLLDDMQKYAVDKNPAFANKLYNVQNIFSTDAQLFDKARSNLIAQVSGSTGMGTDQARAIVEGAIPSYGMSQAAIQEGLRQIKGQVQMRQIKSDYMSDAYANGNAQQYNLRENQFDQTMTPNAASVIKMPAGAQRNTTIEGILKSGDPRDVDALAWAIRTGLLRK